MKMTNLVSRLARRGLDLMPQIKQSLHEFNVLVMLMFCNINSSSNILWIISQNSVQVFHLLSVLLIMLLEATEGVMDGLSFQVMLQSLQTFAMKNDCHCCKIDRYDSEMHFDLSHCIWHAAALFTT